MYTGRPTQPDSNARIQAAICRIAKAYESDPHPWVVGYSGGKDSTAVLTLVFQALRRMTIHHKPLTVIHCNTGVDIPCASRLARRALRSFGHHCREAGLPVEAVTVRPRLSESFFVKILGRGYPPPTDKFRWCTDRLAINPVAAYLKKRGFDRATLLLGVRKQESAARSLTLKENGSADPFWTRQRGHASRRLFMPIVDFSADDVWDANLHASAPPSLEAPALSDLYADASECPSRRRPNGAPCGKARFGCWTCTVAKHAVTLRNLLNSGHLELEPLLEFRLWIEAERNRLSNRWRRRRNGQPGPGPMTKRWRRKALQRLLAAEQMSGFRLIRGREVNTILTMWREK